MRLLIFVLQAEWDMLNQKSSRPDLVKQADTPQKYRHDENVLEVTPAKYRQIKIPGNISLEYVTGYLHAHFLHRQFETVSFKFS
jgi:hypothetical protein